MAWMTAKELAADGDSRITATMESRPLPELAMEISKRVKSVAIIRSHVDGEAVIDEWRNISPETIKFTLNEDSTRLAECLDAMQAVIDGIRAKYYS